MQGKSTVCASLGTQPQLFLTAWWFSKFKIDEKKKTKGKTRVLAKV
jgi:hypothetical protein